jgi:putative transposase
VRYAWMKEHRQEYPIPVMCNVLDVSDSGYYEWLNREPSERHRQKNKLCDAAIKSYFQSNRIYGYRKVYHDLAASGISCCDETVRRILHEKGLFSRVKRKFVVTTDSKHSLAIADNVLERDFEADDVNRKWAADITYIPTAEGWLYLACVMDLYSRRIVGWSMSENIDAELTCSALNMAIRQRHPANGLIHHSDRGVQYASLAYKKILIRCRMTCSMSGKGDCWDNACMESFFGSLKTEWVNHMKYKTREEAGKDVFKYIEAFYNVRRRHASLGYVSPARHEEMRTQTTDHAA